MATTASASASTSASAWASASISISATAAANAPAVATTAKRSRFALSSYVAPGIIKVDNSHLLPIDAEESTTREACTVSTVPAHSVVYASVLNPTRKQQHSSNVGSRGPPSSPFKKAAGVLSLSPSETPTPPSSSVSAFLPPQQLSAVAATTSLTTIAAAASSSSSPASTPFSYASSPAAAPAVAKAISSSASSWSSFSSACRVDVEKYQQCVDLFNQRFGVFCNCSRFLLRCSETRQVSTSIAGVHLSSAPITMTRMAEYRVDRPLRLLDVTSIVHSASRKSNRSMQACTVDGRGEEKGLDPKLLEVASLLPLDQLLSLLHENLFCPLQTSRGRSTLDTLVPRASDEAGDELMDAPSHGGFKVVRAKRRELPRRDQLEEKEWRRIENKRLLHRQGRGNNSSLDLDEPLAGSSLSLENGMDLEKGWPRLGIQMRVSSHGTKRVAAAPLPEPASALIRPVSDAVGAVEAVSGLLDEFHLDGWIFEPVSALSPAAAPAAQFPPSSSSTVITAATIKAPKETTPTLLLSSSSSTATAKRASIIVLRLPSAFGENTLGHSCAYCGSSHFTSSPAHEACELSSSEDDADGSDLLSHPGRPRRMGFPASDCADSRPCGNGGNPAPTTPPSVCGLCLSPTHQDGGSLPPSASTISPVLSVQHVSALAPFISSRGRAALLLVDDDKRIGRSQSLLTDIFGRLSIGSSGRGRKRLL